MTLNQTDIDSLLNAAEDELTGDASASKKNDFQKSITVPSAQAASAIRRSAPEELRRILSMRVPVIVKLAERDLPVSNILDLTNGSILEFERLADSELELLVNNKTIGMGQAVKIGENFGLRITRISSVQNTIQAMGE